MVPKKNYKFVVKESEKLLIFYLIDNFSSILHLMYNKKIAI